MTNEVPYFSSSLMLQFVFHHNVKAILVTSTRGAPRQLMYADRIQWVVWEKGVFGAKHRSRSLIIAVNFVTQVQPLLLSRRNGRGIVQCRNWRWRFADALTCVFVAEHDSLFLSHAYRRLFRVTGPFR